MTQGHPDALGLPDVNMRAGKYSQEIMFLYVDK
jgi:hypothetical protein